MVPMVLLQGYDQNPRDELEFSYAMNSEFRTLVDSIIASGGMNHTPILVYFQFGKFHIVAGYFSDP